MQSHESRRLSAWLIFDVRQKMNLSEAIESFDGWSLPSTLLGSVRLKLAAHPREAKLLEDLVGEASREEHWRTGDLVTGTVIAHRETKKKFPEVEDAVITSIIRAASYEWR